MLKKIQINYQPHHGQAEFHKDRYDVFARSVFAGTGAGKTIAGAYETVLWTFENPGSVGYAFEPTYGMVKRNLIKTLQSPLLFGSPLEASPLIENYNRTDKHLTFTNGSEMWMMSLDEPESAEGPNIDWIWIDEARLIRHIDVAWQVCMRRLRGSKPGEHPVGIWITTTPDAPGSFLFNKFENPKTKLPKKQARIYRWSLDDNPYLTEEYREAVKRSHTGGFYKRFVQGLFAPVAVGSFNFDYSEHVKNNIPELRKIVYGVDFGWTNPTAMVAVGFDNDGRAYAVDEFYQRQAPIELIVEEAKLLQESYGRGDFTCDKSEPRHITDLQIAGLNAVAYSGKRDDGIRELGGRLEKAGDGRPRLFIHPRCVNLISELQVYDAEKKENDHAVDALRYALGSVTGAYDKPFEIGFGKRAK